MIGAGAGERQQKVAAGACEEVGRSAVSLRSAGERRADDDVDATRGHREPELGIRKRIGGVQGPHVLAGRAVEHEDRSAVCPCRVVAGGADEDQRARYGDGGAEAVARRGRGRLEGSQQ
jgi:hypothetical protein